MFDDVSNSPEIFTFVETRTLEITEGLVNPFLVKGVGTKRFGKKWSINGLRLWRIVISASVMERDVS